MMSAEKMQKMQKKALKIGLGDTAKILCDEMDAAKIHIRMGRYLCQRSLPGEPTLEFASRDHLITDRAHEGVADEESEQSNAEDGYNETLDMDTDGYVA